MHIKNKKTTEHRVTVTLNKSDIEDALIGKAVNSSGFHFTENSIAYLTFKIESDRIDAEVTLINDLSSRPELAP